MSRFFKYNGFPALVAACFVFFLTSLKSFAAGGLPTEPFREDAPLEITADNLTFDREMQSYNASGNVVIVQGSTDLKSDFAILDTAAGVANARGNVAVVDEGGNTLTSDSLQMDLRQKTAVIAKGRLFFKTENIHIAADNMYKTGPQTYYLDLATYTSCDCAPGETPAWNFSVKEVNIPVGEFLTGRNAFFYIKGVPVFYSPYVSIPVRRERQTGFLMPKPRYSRLRGFGLDNEFFWAMAKNADMTLYLDIATVRGL
ncbi:MAG: LptA/OstA family protein, partial [Deltaproteobacteria bacterium]